MLMNTIRIIIVISARYLLFPLWVLIHAAGCNNTSETMANNQQQAAETQQLVNGRWQMDRASAEELKGMAMTIDNFALLNKKKFENSGAYQQFGLLLQNHLQRIDTYCKLNTDCHDRLYTKLNEIKAELPVLSTGNLSDGKAALGRVKAIWAQVDSAFIYQ